MSDITMPERRREFAPISSQPSGRLQFIAGYFSLSGGLTVLGTCLGAAFMLMSSTPNMINLALLAGLGSAIAMGYFWTGQALREQSKMGWYAGLLTLAAPLVPAIVGRPIATWTLILGAVGLGFLASVRHELR